MRSNSTLMNGKIKTGIGSFFLYIVSFAILVIAFFPLYWLVSMSLRKGLDIFRLTLFPEKVYFTTYQYILTHTSFLVWFKNSVVVSALSTLVSVVVASLSAYSMSRFVTGWKKFISKSILMAYMFPPILLTLPLFVLFVNINLLNTQLGLIIAYSMSNLPFAMWLLTAYFETIPKEIDEAAKIDGAGNNYIFWRMILPMATPGLATSAIFVFIGAWNEFILALILISKEALKTLPIGLYARLGGKNGEPFIWDELLTNAAMVILPMLLVFLLMNKYITKGLTAGALKG